ncbi:MAG: M28 family peptidase [Chthoniobacterales bacterium]
MRRFILWLVLIAVAGVALVAIKPPAAVGPDAPPEQFSAARAMSHLQHFATKPHPIGSAANATARDYLATALTALGGEVRVERTVGLHARGRFIRAGNAENIVARFPGRANQRAVMLVAHYDSVPQGPGAADDGAGVISILETVRALRAGPPLQNDVLVLLTDGEEPGLLGSAGFVADHPDLARQVGVILNLEARGTSGPALMFETSVGNGWLIHELAQSAPSLLASSLMYAAYQLLPNDTDLSELKRTGVPAMNFAFTETIQCYHTRLDTKENLDPRSVQHLGANVLGLSQHFGHLPLTETRKPDCVYFDWLGHRLVHYPMWMVWVIALATFALLLAAWLTGRRDHAVTFSFTGIVAFLLLLGAAAGGMLALWSSSARPV